MPSQEQFQLDKAHFMKASEYDISESVPTHLYRASINRLSLTFPYNIRDLKGANDHIAKLV